MYYSIDIETNSYPFRIWIWSVWVLQWSVWKCNSVSIMSSLQGKIPFTSRCDVELIKSSRFYIEINDSPLLPWSPKSSWHIGGRYHFYNVLFPSSRFWYDKKSNSARRIDIVCGVKRFQIVRIERLFNCCYFTFFVVTQRLEENSVA